MADIPTIHKIPALPPEAERAKWTEPHIITTCTVLHMSGPDPDQDGRMYVGHCPACHLSVFDDQDPVWTCPANLQENNPHYEKPTHEITEEMQEKAGVYSLCGYDWAYGCYEDMPLHGKCYNSQTLTH